MTFLDVPERRHDGFHHGRELYRPMSPPPIPMANAMRPSRAIPPTTSGPGSHPQRFDPEYLGSNPESCPYVVKRHHQYQRGFDPARAGRLPPSTPGRVKSVLFLLEAFANWICVSSRTFLFGCFRLRFVFCLQPAVSKLAHFAVCHPQSIYLRGSISVYIPCHDEITIKILPGATQIRITWQLVYELNSGRSGRRGAT